MTDDETRLRARLREYGDGIEPIRDIPAAGRARFRRRVRRRRAAALFAGAFAVVAAAGIGVEVSRRPAHTLQFQTHGSAPTSVGSSTPGSAEASSTTIAPGGIVSGLSLADTSWVSNDEGWALVKSALLHTTDGGVTWTKVSTPPATVIGGDCSKVACVSHVRFADPEHGWLFDPSLLSTTDGGKTWTTDVSVTVEALEVAHGRAFRVVTGSGCSPPGCAYFVETTTVGSTSWRRLATPSVVGDAARLLYDGPRVYVALFGNPAGGAPTAHIQILRSVDAGKTWQLRPDPCGFRASEELDTASLAAAPGGFLVALCQPRGYDHGLFVSTSFDAGSTFGSPIALPLSSSAVAGAVAAGSPDSIAVGAGDGTSQLVMVSHDKGATWNTTLRTRTDTGGCCTFLGFEDANTARVAFTGDRLWTTRDAGTTWTLGRP